jgi:hypothetical protein
MNFNHKNIFSSRHLHTYYKTLKPMTTPVLYIVANAAVIGLAHARGLMYIHMKSKFN